MFRIWTYLTLVAGEPTVAGTYFDPVLIDLNVGTGNNMIISQVRDGTRRILKDPQAQYEVEGTIALRTPHVDKLSESLYLGSYRYLGPVLYYLHRAGLPICLFLHSSINTHKKSYLCYIRENDPVLTAQSNINTDEAIVLRRDSMPRVLQFSIEIALDGIFTDIDDITTANWNARDSA